MIKLSGLLKKVFLLAIVFAYIQTDAQDTLDISKIESGVDKYLIYFSGENPGAVVTVIKKGEVVFNKGYGRANKENQVIMQGDELFNLGELSKSFTALAVLNLVEKNKLSFDNTLNEIFPEFPDYGKTITIKYILDHKSGLPNYNAKDVSSNEDVYNFLLKQNEPVFEPGSKFIYSNSDYPLLVKIIEESAKMSYQEYLRKYIFKKLEMNNTYFAEEIDNKNIAFSHFKEQGDYIVEKQPIGIFGEQGIYMNSADYAKYDKAMYTDKILKCESLKKIFRVGKLSNKENISDYTCGWVLMARLGVRYFWQGGSQGGYSNMVLHLPDTQTTVLILTNRNDGYDFLKMAIYIAKLFDTQLML